MGIYELIKIALIVCAGILGVVSVACPKAMLKAEDCEDTAKLNKSRVLGVVIIIATVALVYLQFFM